MPEDKPKKEEAKKEEKKEEKKGIEITIVDRTEVTTYPKLKTPVVNVMITYVAGEYPPRTVTIPKKEYNKEKEKAVIRKDIESIKKIPPETYTI